MDKDKQIAKIKEGPKIFIASILSVTDYREAAKKYPNTYTNGPVAPVYFKSEFDWRYRMGGTYTEAEIKVLNDNLELLKKVLKEIAEKAFAVMDFTEVDV